MPDAIEAGQKLQTYNKMIQSLKESGLIYKKEDGQVYAVDNF